MNTNKTLLIFDLDGTLIDSLPDISAALNTALSQHHLPTQTPEKIRTWIGKGTTILIQNALHHIQQTPASEEQIHSLQTHYLNAYQQHPIRHTTPYPHAHQTLQQLAPHYTLALCSNKPRALIDPILQHLNWHSYFNLILGGDSLKERKPHPAPLLYICQHLNHPPKQTYLIGDSENDLIAGQRAHIDTLALTHGYHHGTPLSQHHPKAQFDTLQHLTAYLLPS